MPTYTYKRLDGSIFEAFQSIKDDALSECPETGQCCERIIVSAPGLAFRGSGWTGLAGKPKGPWQDFNQNNNVNTEVDPDGFIV